MYIMSREKAKHVRQSEEYYPVAYHSSVVLFADLTWLRKRRLVQHNSFLAPHCPLSVFTATPRVAPYTRSGAYSA